MTMSNFISRVKHCSSYSKLNITCIIKESKLNIQCGAGIVFDSVPEREWEETINKGMAIIQAYKNLCGEVK